jgi:molecular chaperone DnaK (HSP70)
MIEKNTRIPVSTTDQLFTVHEGQTEVQCTVTQSATLETDPDFVRIIWEGELGPLPPGRPSEQPIDITFSYDANQVMQCAFVDVASGTRKEVSLGMAGSSSTNVDVDKFTVS